MQRGLPDFIAAARDEKSQPPRPKEHRFPSRAPEEPRYPKGGPDTWEEEEELRTPMQPPAPAHSREAELMTPPDRIWVLEHRTLLLFFVCLGGGEDLLP